MSPESTPTPNESAVAPWWHHTSPLGLCENDQTREVYLVIYSVVTEFGPSLTDSAGYHSIGLPLA
jgi:hypothetical protein